MYMEKESDLKLLSKIKNELKERSYTEVQFNLPKEELNKAATAFLEFLKLPEELKEKIYFQIVPNNRGYKVGYEKTQREYGDTDNKELFQYNEYAEEAFKELIDTKKEIAEFFKSTRKIYEEAKSVMDTIIKLFDKEFPGLHKKFFPEDTKPYFYLRFLKYNATNKGNFLAKGHYDRGSCTLALAESAPGLRIGKNDINLSEVKHKEKTAFFILGINFKKITSEELLPSWHDVVQKSEDCYSKEIARWAIVFFADPVGINNDTYEEAHTPIK